MKHWPKNLSLGLIFILGVFSSGCTFQAKPISEGSSPEINPFSTAHSNPLVCPVLPQDPTRAELAAELPYWLDKA